MDLDFPIQILVNGKVISATGVLLPPILTILIVVISIVSFIGFIRLYSDRVYLKKNVPESLAIMEAKRSHSPLLMIPDNANSIMFAVAEKKEESVAFDYDGKRGLQIDPAILSGSEAYTLLGSNIKAYLWPYNSYFPIGDKGMRVIYQILAHIRNTTLTIDEYENMISVEESEEEEEDVDMDMNMDNGIEFEYEHDIDINIDEDDVNESDDETER